MGWPLVYLWWCQCCLLLLWKYGGLPVSSIMRDFSGWVCALFYCPLVGARFTWSNHQVPPLSRSRLDIFLAEAESILVAAFSPLLDHHFAFNCSGSFSFSCLSIAFHNIFIFLILLRSRKTDEWYMVVVKFEQDLWDAFYTGWWILA